MQYQYTSEADTVPQRSGVEWAPASYSPILDPDDVEDLEDAPDDEVAAVEEEILDQATAARSIAELSVEIQTLQGLETLALNVRRCGTDTKWRELANLLTEIFTPAVIANRLAEEGVSYSASPLPRPVPSPRQKLAKLRLKPTRGEAVIESRP